jgi:hypothetical protein
MTFAEIYDGDRLGLAALVEKIRGNGWSPLPVIPPGHLDAKGNVARGAGKGALDGAWQRRRFRGDDFERWHRKIGRAPSIGLKLDGLVAVDIDCDDEEEAAEMQALVAGCLGETPFIRIGRAPRVALFFRGRMHDAAWSPKWSPVALKHGPGHQMVAYGQHPRTGQGYRWIGPAPDNGRLEDAPEITAEQIASLVSSLTQRFQPADSKEKTGVLDHRSTSTLERLFARQIAVTTTAAQIDELQGALYREWVAERIDQAAAEATEMRLRTRRAVHAAGGAVVVPEKTKAEPKRRAKATDGRRQLLLQLVFRHLRPLLRAGADVDPRALVEGIWLRFQAEADVTIPKGNGRGYWTRADVEHQVGADLVNPANRKRILAAKEGAKFWTIPRKGQWIAMIARHFPAAAVNVATAIANAARDGRGVCRLSRHQLAEVAGVNFKTAERARSRLVQAGYLILIERGRPDRRGGRGKATIVQLNSAVLAGDLLPVVSSSVADPFPLQPFSSLPNMPQHIDALKETGALDHPTVPTYLNDVPPLAARRASEHISISAPPPPLSRPAQSATPADTALASQPLNLSASAEEEALRRWPSLFYRTLAGTVEPIPGADRVEVGEALKALRREAGISQTEAARRACLSQGGLSNAERGHDALHPARVAALLRALAA